MQDQTHQPTPPPAESAPWPPWRCGIHQTTLSGFPERLECAQSHSFPVVKGVPRFVEGSNYADHFGSQWNRFRRTQLDSHTGHPITRDRLLRCLGPALAASIKGKHVLECGCGAGRFTEILLELGAKVTSVDLSTAVDANADQFPPGDFHRIAQADIGKLPFSPRSYDVVVCLGVIQHTPDPEATIRHLFEHVAPGGWLIIDHYYLTISWYLKSAPLFRILMTRLSPPKAMRLTEMLVKNLLPVHKAVQRVPVVRSLVHRLSPVMCYYTVLPQLNDAQQYDWALLDTHDSLTDHFKHSRSKNQITQTLAELGGENVWSEYGGNGVEARSQRPVGMSRRGKVHPHRSKIPQQW